MYKKNNSWVPAFLAAWFIHTRPQKVQLVAPKKPSIISRLLEKALKGLVLLFIWCFGFVTVYTLLVTALSGGL